MFNGMCVCFAMGKYASKLVPRLEGCRLIDFSRLPIVIYTGHAALSPLKSVSRVLSDARITGAIVAPGGKRLLVLVSILCRYTLLHEVLTWIFCHQSPVHISS